MQRLKSTRCSRAGRQPLLSRGLRGLRLLGLRPGLRGLAHGNAAPSRLPRLPVLLLGGLLPVLLLALPMASCTGPVPITPYPSVVYVGHPLHETTGDAAVAWEEANSVSPERDPDGLGVLSTLWLNSRMTLVPWAAAQQREARNRIAYARSAAEQQQAIDHARALYDQHWVFEGLLLADLPELVQLEFYQPEGIYLLDDQGRKFLPVQATQQDIPSGASVTSRFGQSHFSFPRLVFPHEAIGEDTRWVALYFAAGGKRARFTWVFDPAAIPHPSGQGEQAAPRRLFRAH